MDFFNQITFPELIPIPISIGCDKYLFISDNLDCISIAVLTALSSAFTISTGTNTDDQSNKYVYIKR